MAKKATSKDKSDMMKKVNRIADKLQKEAGQTTKTVKVSKMKRSVALKKAWKEYKKK